MKQRFLILMASLLLFAGAAWAYVPNEQYAKFTRRFQVDYAWVFTSRCETNTNTSGNGWCNERNDNPWTEQDVHLERYPGYIAWSHMSWDEKVNNGDDHDMDWIHLRLYNSFTKQWCDLCYIDLCGDDDNSCVCTIDNKGSGTTYAVGRRYYHNYHDGAVFSYYLIQYNETVRQFIQDAGEYLELWNQTRWDDDHWNTYTEKSSVHTAEHCSFIQSTPEELSLDASEVRWTASGSNPALTLPVRAHSNYNRYDVVLYRSGKECYRWQNVTPKNEATLLIPAGTVDAVSLASGAYSVRVEGRRDYSFSTGYYMHEPGDNAPIPPSSTTLLGYSATVPMPVCQMPTNGLQVEDMHDGTVRLRWQVSDRIDGRAHDASDWVLERSTAADFSANLVVLEPQPYNASTMEYTVTNSIPERNQGLLQYYYRLYRRNLSPRAAGIQAGCEFNSDYVQPFDFEIAEVNPTEGTIRVRWSARQGIWTPNMTFNLLLNDASKWHAVRTDTTYTFQGIRACEAVRLAIRVEEQAAVRGAESSLPVFRMPSAVPSRISRISTSKGYYNDHVELVWHVERNANNFSQFTVERKDYDAPDANYHTVGSSIRYVDGIVEYTLTDNSVTPGVFYAYRINGWTSCGDSVGITDSHTEIGFAQPYGLVTGIIAYDGNQGVSGADVHAVGESSARRNRSIRLERGSRIRTQKDTVGLYGNRQGTIEMWLRDSAEYGFRHYARTWDATHVEYYLDGRLQSRPLAMPDRIEDGRLVIGGQFAGWIDEIRCWDVHRDSTSIRNLYDRYLSGHEANLTLYYRCDDMIPDVLYDLSKTGSRFNERHADTHGVLYDGNNTPTVDQLSLRSYTDDKGVYTINAIPYSADGTMYTITPMLGVHEFAPNSRSLYFTSTTSTHNSIDFTDRSSFTVTGSVFYENSTIPVEGCMFRIDGTQICTREGKPVLSDANGEFSISVPIGHHFITVEKDGHSFAFEGRYPAREGSTYEFVGNMPHLSFTDVTKVLLVGRVAGGNVQAEKPHGMHMGTNNIGCATVQMQLTTEKYALVTDTVDRIWQYPDSFLCSSHAITTRVPGRKHMITVTTDSLTGEYALLVPPVDFEVTSVSIASNPNIQLDRKYLKRLELSKHTAAMYTDSLRIDSAHVMRRTYNLAHDIIWQSQPVITLRQDGGLALGDRTMRCSLTSKPDSVFTREAWTRDSLGVITYTLGKPVFRTDNAYTWDLHVADIYTNLDPGTKVRPDTVPWSNGRVQISCEMAAEPKVELRLDARGLGSWSWQAGAPNMAAPYTVGMQIFVSDSLGRNSVEWGHNSDFRAYVQGAKPEAGNDFVTMGPNEILYILRCPPGKSSSVTLHSGTNTSYSRDSEKRYKGEEDLVTATNFGGGFKTMTGGPFLMVMTSLLVYNELTVGMHADQAYTAHHTGSYAVTTTRDITLSRDPEFKGAMGDVYYGHATNMIFGSVKQLAVTIDSTGHYDFAVRSGISQRDTIATSFAYTQSEIINREIPLLRQNRTRFPVIHVDSYDSLPANTGTVYRYYTTLAATDPARYEEGNYRSVAPEKSGLGNKIVRDSIELYNVAIEGWEQAIRNNEQAKVTAIKAGTRPYDADEYRKGVCRLEFYRLLSEKKWQSGDLSVGEEGYAHYRDIIDISISPNYQSYTISSKRISKFLGDYKLEEKGYITRDSKQNRTYHTAPLDVFYNGGYFHENFSISGSASVSESVGTSESNGRSDNFSYHINAVLGDKGGVKINNTGVIITGSTKQGGGNAYTNQYKTDKSNSVSYRLDANTYETYTVDVYRAPDGFGPIFYTRAGESYCPYEAPDSTIFYVDTLTHKRQPIQGGTIHLQQPRITINSLHNITIDNIPAGQSASVQAVLANLGESLNKTMSMDFILRPVSNAAGINVAVDGYTLGLEGQHQFIGCPATVTKTITFTQTDLSVDSAQVDLILRSACDYTVEDRVHVTLHFVPACTALTLESETNLMNTVNSDTLRLTIRGYNTTFANFSGIRLERRAAGTTRWQTEREFTPVTTDRIVFPFTLHPYDDGEYELRAVSVCRNGAETIETESNILTITKDMHRPTVLGACEPSNGYYTVGSELAINWNEPINANLLTKRGNFRIEGLLGEAPVAHSVAYNTNHPTRTEAQYSVLGTTIGAEMWMRYLDGSGSLLSLGYMDVRINKDHYLEVQLGETIVVSHDTLPAGRWMYLYLSLDQSGSSSVLRARAWADAETIHLFGSDSAVALPRLYTRAALTLGDANLYARVHDLRLWTVARSEVQAQSEMNHAPYLYTPGLHSYWPMSEGHGRIMEDLTRDRHFPISESAWYIEGTNYAASLPDGHLDIDITRVNLAPTDEYVLGYWYRATAGDTLFAIRRAESVKAIRQSGLADGEWHHVALAYVRNGYASLYIDGALRRTILQSEIDGMVGTSLRLYGDAVDEIRCWRGRMDGTLLRNRRFERVENNVDGLLWRFAFERDTVDSGSQPMVAFTTRAAKGDCRIVAANRALQAGDCPPLHKAPTLEEVEFDFSSGSDRTTFTLSSNVSTRLEGSTLTISAAEVPDMHGNRSDVISWQFMVDRSRLSWEEPVVEKSVLQETTDTVALAFINRSGISESWSISGEPSWLNIATTSGTIAGMSEVVVRATVSEALTPGFYTATLYLTGSENVRKPLELIVHVYATPPAWEYDESRFDRTMNIVGQLQLPSGYADNEDNIVAAFAGGRCVGLARTLYYSAKSTYFVMMSVGADENTPLSAPLEFRVWESSTGRIFAPVRTMQNGADLPITFSDGRIWGTMANPVQFVTRSSIQEQLDLNTGWNWISFYVDPANRSFDTIMRPIIRDIVQLKSSGGVSVTNGTSLSGPVRTMNPTRMYKLKMSAPAELDINGVPCTPASFPISIHPNWNWIGYLSTKNMRVGEAFSLISPAEGDVVKSRTGFAMWSDGVWVGPLTILRPGEGYMYFSARPVGDNFDLIYPSFGAYTEPVYMAAGRRDEGEEANHFTLDVDGAFPTTMGVIARVMDGDTELTGVDVAAFVGNQCRGVGVWDDGLMFLSFEGETGEKLSFCVWDGTEARVAPVTVDYVSDELLGTVASPYIIQLAEGTGLPSSESSSAARVTKVVRDGIVYIVRGDRLFTTTGQEVKW